MVRFAASGISDANIEELQSLKKRPRSYSTRSDKHGEVISPEIIELERKVVEALRK